MNPLDHRLVQHDRRSCGPSVLVVARMLHDPHYAAYVDAPARFATEVLALHRRVTSSVDARGRFQPPWPRALGVPPWAVAHEMEAITGRRHRTQPVWPTRRAEALERIRTAASVAPVPLYVGNRWLPRHVVLVLDAELRTWNPARGSSSLLAPADFCAARIGPGRWTHAWFSVLPD